MTNNSSSATIGDSYGGEYLKFKINLDDTPLTTTDKLTAQFYEVGTDTTYGKQVPSIDFSYDEDSEVIKLNCVTFNNDMQNVEDRSQYDLIITYTDGDLVLNSKRMTINFYRY